MTERAKATLEVPAQPEGYCPPQIGRPEPDDMLLNEHRTWVRAGEYWDRDGVPLVIAKPKPKSELWVVMYVCKSGIPLLVRRDSRIGALSWAEHARARGQTVLSIIRVPEGQFDVGFKP